MIELLRGSERAMIELLRGRERAMIELLRGRERATHLHTCTPRDKEKGLDSSVCTP